MRYYLVAGEASGDLHGSNLMKGLKEADSSAEFRFWGGDLMSSVGGTLVKHYKETAIMGYVEILKSLNKVTANLNLCKKDILDYRPDVLILIDYPGFNFRIAKFAKANGIKVFYYIAPKVWAWKESRVHRLQKDIDKLFIIFPFEVEYFKKWSIDAIYCGNPLLDSIDNDPSAKESRADFLKRNSLNDKPSIAILAGSRKSEIEYLLPRFIASAIEIDRKKSPLHYQYIIAAAPSIDLCYYDKFIERFRGKCDIKVVQGDTYAAMKNSEAAIVASGTASLEAALIGIPQVVCYGGNPVSFYIASKLVKLKYISLGNLIIDRQAFKELLQKDCNPELVSQEVVRLLDDSKYRNSMLDSYKEIRDMLGNGGASHRVAEAMISEIHKINNPNESL